ncbi:MAG TPA: hypothetical protein VMR62_35785 [Bryobacteraceae bacterium]|jgi:hypothetical protein|nr:hypothetical protein [Bryobacteraceae bacterium]
MSVTRVVSLSSLFLGLFLRAHSAHGMDCSGLPTTFTGKEFPTGDFFTNFDSPCYTVNLGSGVGNIEYGDLNATYYQLYFKVDPRYQLILLGTLPNTRYFSVSLNDTHSALSQSILDTNIVPLTSQYINPYLPGVSYVPGQQYAVPINFGGTPGNEQTGCKMQGYNVSVNGLDATQRHPGMDWNSNAGFFQQFPGMMNHGVDTPQHTNPNNAGVILVRAYLDETPRSYANNPHIIVRDVASGCAYPAAYALNTLQIVADNSTTASHWLDSSQYYGHHTYETSYLPKLCNAPPASPNVLQWSRLPEYVPATNPNAAYIAAGVPEGLPASLAAAGEVMRIRIRVPVTPPTPCTNGCTRSGNEQMRYMSLSFTAPGGATLASIADTAFTKDPHGYATLIVGTGATIPKWITAANGYTFLDLTAINGYQQLTLLSLRHIIPGTDFNCAGQFVPYRTAVDTPSGNLLGDYAPVVDYPLAATLPHKASPLKGLSACGMFPGGQPGIQPACGVLPAPPPMISAVVTQCQAPGCDQFAAQPNPPISIVGEGFGMFPEGTPFTGTSRYFELENITRGWVAGFTGSACTVSISSWDINSIQLVANVNVNGKCPLHSGDHLMVVVWNPQTMISTTSAITAQ